MKVELALDTSKWVGKSPKYLIEDLASAILEFGRKINPYWLDYEAIKKLKKSTRRDTPIFAREYKALEQIGNWLLEDGDKYYAWISSSCDLYPTSRIIVGKKFTEGVLCASLNRALCITNDPADCLHIANLLAEFSSKSSIFTDSEQLRSQIITFNIPQNTSLAEFLIGTLGYLSEIEKIQTGQDMQDKAGAREEAKIIVLDNYRRIQNTPSGIAQIYIGASIEEQLLARGYQVNKFGDCPGITNTEALGILGAFSKIFMLSNPNPEADKYTYNKLDTCRMCNKLKMVCPPPQGCSVCRDCTVADNFKSVV